MNPRMIFLSTIAASTLLLSGGLALADQDAPVGQSSRTDRSASHAANTQDPFEVSSHLAASFDRGIKGHENIPSWQEARKLRAQGGRLCAKGSTARGIDDLQNALAQIGVVPQPHY